MSFKIHMGIPEMKEKWDNLKKKHKENTLNKDEEDLYNKWGKAMAKLAFNPFYPGLETHEIDALTKRYGIKVWQSYLENKTSKARRLYWVYGPNKTDITIIGLEPHPEDKKNGAYGRITLSAMGEEENT